MAENICHAAVKQIEKQPVRSAKHTLTMKIVGATVLISGALTQPILTQITTALARPVEPDTWRNLKNATIINFEQEIIEQKNIYNIYTFL